MWILNNEKRIRAIDFDPKSEIVYWADSYDQSIKRSYMVDAKDGQVKVGYPQDLNIKGPSKPVAVAIDWVGDNLYWAEIDLSKDDKPAGRIMVAKQDGRYRRSIISGGVYENIIGRFYPTVRFPLFCFFSPIYYIYSYLLVYTYIALDSPSSMVLDPEKGKMFWADVGESPKIEMSWMDGSRRMPLVTTRLHHPTGLTVDTAMDHALYWVDTKLNVIESIKYDQKNRVVVIRGGEYMPRARLSRQAVS